MKAKCHPSYINGYKFNTVNEIGDEFHYLFRCSFFSTEQARYIMRYYYTQPNMYKLTQLFESSDFTEMLNLAKFAGIIVSHFK